MIDAGAVIAQLRATDARCGGAREAWREPWVAERQRLDEIARSAAPDVVIERDAFANTWYVLAGDREETVLVHSHSDCVPRGGWLDGILGVHAGLGVLAALAAQPSRRRTLAVVDWADEEGTRFGRSLLGSSAAAGSLTGAELDALTADDGRPAPEVVAEHGFDTAALGTPSPRLAKVAAAAELHIEQGPRLQREGRSVAAVAGCLGVRRYRITFEGIAGHAGALPMADRQDPVRAAAAFITALLERAEATGGLATVGWLQSDPMIATAVGLVDLYRSDPVRFDPALVATAVAAAGGGAPLISGPLHDSAALAQAGIPAVMLFAPLEGVSHGRAEDTDEADLIVAIGALQGLVTRLIDARDQPD